MIAVHPEAGGKLKWALPDGSWRFTQDRDDHDHVLLDFEGDLVGVLKYEREPGGLHLLHLLIQEAHRGKKLGGEMLDEFLRRMGLAGPGETVYCEVQSETPDKVAALLESRGFKSQGGDWKRML